LTCLLVETIISLTSAVATQWVEGKMGLEEYRRKREFRKTPEPSGRSWAVPKGVPLEPGVRRLAVQVEDHPVEYLDFAGTIPEGEYGAGTVEIWDKGNFELDQRASDRLEFTLKGEKLSGGYVLIHTDKNNWLLLKRKEKSG